MPSLGSPSTEWSSFTASCPQCCRDHETQPLQAKVACHPEHFPLIPNNLCLSAWPSSRKALQTNTNYPCCCTWRIEAHFAAGAAHFPASVSNSPPPPALSKKCTGGHATHQSVCLHSKLYQEARHWSWVSLTSHPAGYRMPQPPLLTEADAAASAFGTDSLRLLKATALHLWKTRARH